ncbi:uncharacterized protein AB675_683 [Cyphellophora attinorum]|uniref:Uncharacterized protein n=1 Tax=Cyphellophora attinorum TaxID=1664694 RepID=A0A0N1HB40_9EURO|nr:uncharacterized protein AB675_683 [Phialophora attinorum]KPI45597.1 hypothetical protein AB675_683 [Phialophora attinorum]
MSSSDIRTKPFAVSLTITIVVASAYLLYRTYSASVASPAAGLRRSNAVRRPRRQHAEANLNALHSQQSQESESDIHNRSRLVEAVSHLDSTLANDPYVYAEYQNEELLGGIDPAALPSLHLHPANLPNIYPAVFRHGPSLNDQEQRWLQDHIDASFIHVYLRRFFNEGHQLSDDLRNELAAAFGFHGIELSQDVVYAMLDRLSAGTPLPTWRSLNIQIRAAEMIAQADGVRDDPMSLDEPLRDADEGEDSDRAHNMLDLLYNIARKQADRHGIVHRGVECNSCGVCPIQGVRYHCTNCFDFDLCEACESKDVHLKTHVFLKITIPAPSRGQIKSVVPSWYPGKPNAFSPMVPLALLDKLKEDTGLDQPDIQGLYEQFRCLAGCHFPSDPAELGTVIDRKAFEKYMIPSYLDKPTPANLIYERIFAFYDTNDDKHIDFLEFVRGLTKLNDKSFAAKITRIFRGHDLDGDGYVSRKDFLRMLRAYYDLNTQFNREMLYRNEELDLADDIRDVVQSNHPISSAFGGINFPGHVSRAGQDKRQLSHGDLGIIQGPNGVLLDDVDMQSHRHKAIAMVPYEARERHPFRSFREYTPQDDPVMNAPFTRRMGEFLSITNAHDATEDELSGPDRPLQTYGWPPVVPPEPEDIINALGVDIPIDQIDDPVDRSRVIYAQSQRFDEEYAERRDNARQRVLHDRWERRQFYLDQEEGMTRPAAYVESDSSEDELEPEHEPIDSSRGQSMRSRSSSKVRFDDSAIDTDYETRSNASSRSVPQNERWGGFELSRPTLDIGADVLYEAVQQGFNELIDCIFKEKEDKAIEAQRTRKQRETWEKLLDEYAENRNVDDEQKNEALLKADSLRTEELLNGGPRSPAFEFTITGDEANENPQAVMLMREELSRVLNAVTQPPKSRTPSATRQAADYRDPTLPQFRPNDAGEAPRDVPTDEELQPSPKTLALWLKHREIESEAESRGGFGLLNLMEFRKIVEVVLEQETDELHSHGATARAGEGAAGQPSSAENADTVGPGGNAVAPEHAVKEWSRNFDLGKLSFLGTWIEMAGL